MARTTGRTAAETRQLVIRAAADVVADRGGSAGLEEIASRAQVTKGGLLYHFGSKESLMQAVAQQLLDEFEDDVARARRDDDTEPGSLTRAYVRGSLESAADAERTRRHATLLVHLQTDPAIAAMMQRDAERWRDRLLADGLDPMVATLAVAAADGICMAPLYGEAPLVADKEQVLQAVLALTRR